MGSRNPVKEPIRELANVSAQPKLHLHLNGPPLLQIPIPRRKSFRTSRQTFLFLKANTRKPLTAAAS